jgi:hypothetical protein
VFVRPHIVVLTVRFVATFGLYTFCGVVDAVWFVHIGWFDHLFHVKALLHLFDRPQRPSLGWNGLSLKSQGLDYATKVVQKRVSYTHRLLKAAA